MKPKTRDPKGIVAEWQRACLFNIAEGCVRIYQEVFLMRMRKELPLLDTVLAVVDAELLPIQALVAILTGTAAVAGSLTNRARVYQAAERKAKDKRVLLGLACEDD